MLWNINCGHFFPYLLVILVVRHIDEFESINRFFFVMWNEVKETGVQLGYGWYLVWCIDSSKHVLYI